MYNKFRAWVLILIIGVAGLVSFFSSYYLINVYYAGWETTTGTVVSAVQTHAKGRGVLPFPEYHITYSYGIDGDKHVSKSIYKGNLPESIKAEEVYDVWYNPEKSEFLDPKEHTSWVYPLLIGAFACWVYVVPFVFKKKSVVSPNTLHKHSR